MTRSLLDEVTLAMRRDAALAPGDAVLVGVSGGADSTALLAALQELAPALGIRVVAAHLDHGLRGAESAADAAFVAVLAERLGVPLVAERAVVPAGNLEAQARRVRYAFLERTADRTGAARIATAHTRDDQAETVLLRLARGAGPRGLAGIRPRRGRIVRPLLACDREQVRRYLVARGLDWRRDRSNFDLAHARNRVRHGWLPALARDLNPRLAAALAGLADVLREEDRLLDRLASVPGVRAASLDLRVLRVLDPPLARRALLRWWRRHGPDRRLGRVHLEAVLRHALRPEGGGEIPVPGGAVVRDGDVLRLRIGSEPAVAPYRHELAAGTTVEAGGWRLRATAVDAPVLPPTDAGRCVVDAGLVPAILTVRNRRPGDRLRLHGLDGGHATVKRLLAARGVPRAERAGHPLVLAGDEILWIPGCGRSDHALVTQATRHVLVLHAERSVPADPSDAGG